MVGQIHHFKFEIENKSEIDVEVVIDNDNPPSVDEVDDLVRHMAEELYSSIINISES